MRSILLMMILTYGDSIRIPLSYYSNSPFLQHSVNTKKGNSFNHDSLVTFSWSNVFLGKLLHRSNIVEVGARGVRFIEDVGKLYMEDGNLALSNHCSPSDLALCYVNTKEGWILPSEGKWPTPVTFNVTSNSSLLGDSVMSLFAGETSCHMENQGGSRAYTNSPVEYSVTSCDILYGKLVIVFHITEETVYVYPQSFGPIAYLLILISATISTGAIAFLSKAILKENKVVVVVEKPGQNDTTRLKIISYIPIGINVNVFVSLLVCAIIFFRNKIHFHTEGDFYVFIMGIITGIFYEVSIIFYVLYVKNKEQWLVSMEIDACLYALQTISIALYRTPENPYTSILFFFMACRIWEKVFVLCHGMNSSSLGEIKYTRYIDGILALVNFNLISEFGMKKQYIFQDVWPIYFTLFIFISFCLVKYRWIQSIIQF